MPYQDLLETSPIDKVERPSAGALKCDVCEERFDHYKDLNSHVRIHF